ncbi:MAG: hypothetical protein ACLFQB_00985 [Chitinispirillaceae bacterium]
MDSVSSARTAASIEAMSRVVQQSNDKMTEMSEKLLRFNVEQVVGKETAKGELLDLIA